MLIRRPTGSISWVMRIQNQIYHDLFTSEMIWHDLSNLYMPSFGAMSLNEATPKTVSPVLETSEVAQTAVEPTVPSIESIVIPQKKKEKVVKLELEMDPKKESVATKIASSGPIDIPKKPPKVKESGSISDHDEEDDSESDNLVPFDDQDGRSRNPVRRVNSSPEMGANYRKPFLISQSKAINQSGDGETENRDENVEGQQKKKNYCKDMRVSCEAIPEEMTGQTPPSNVGSVTNDSILDELVAQSAKISEPEVKKTEIIKELELKKELFLKSPKKQMDDPPKLQVNLKIPMEVTQKITTKPPQSPVPLSPRLLAKNVGNKFTPSVFSHSSLLNEAGNPNNTNEDQPRLRSKTISVVPSRERYSKHLPLKSSSGQGKV